MHLLQTKRTYATRENALRALANALGNPESFDNVRYLIAVNDEGRFAPVLVGNQYIPFAVNGNVTVVS